MTDGERDNERGEIEEDRRRETVTDRDGERGEIEKDRQRERQ